MAYRNEGSLRIRYFPGRSLLLVWKTHPNSLRLDWQLQVLSDIEEFPGWHSRGMLEAHRHILNGN